MTTVQMTPSSTPLAMTRPISRPSVRRMVHSARKPAMVVSELPVMEDMVAVMALAMASSLLAQWASSSEKRCRRKMEKSMVTASCSTAASAWVM